MPSEDQDLLDEFVVESQEHLSDIESQLLTLESQGDQMDTNLVNTVFRAMHSIKGAAGFLGLDTLEGLAHREEEVLNMLRNDELYPNSEVINTLLSATDRIKELLSNIESSNDCDVSQHLEALERLRRAGPMAEEKQGVNEAAGEGAGQNAGRAEQAVGQEGVSGEGLREFLAEGYDSLKQVESDLSSLAAEPNNQSLVDSGLGNVQKIESAAALLGFQNLEDLSRAAKNLLGCLRSSRNRTSSDISEIAEGLSKAIAEIHHILRSIELCGVEGDADYTALLEQLSQLGGEGVVSDAGEDTEAKRRAATRSSGTVTPTVNVSKMPAPVSDAASSASEASANEGATTGVAESTIRVDVSSLDKLMTSVGELVLARNQILQFTDADVDGELYHTSQRLNAITSELQECVMKTRMQPIGNVWSKFPRLVRDLAGTCKKQVRIEMEGRETELDKSIIESIKDPLTHLVRNAVDHGIESAEVRVENGKTAEGCLTLRAFHEGGQVNIEICDDGAGVQVERVKAKALERGLMTEEQLSRLADRDVGNLIFLPGFSTAQTVSNVSGRGVGMDVVKTNIEKIGGTVDLQSEQGVGTTVKIKIPLTLAIVPALIASCDENRYAIPQVNLLEVVRLDGDQLSKSIEWIQGAPVYRLRGNLLPLVFLRKELRCKANDYAAGETLNIVVLRAGDRQFGLIVDRINDSEEIVVKPLSKQLKDVPVYSGATIMGDGRVALILDVLGLAHSSNAIAEESDQKVKDKSTTRATHQSDPESLIIVSEGINRFAIPLRQVTRLEKIDVDQIEVASQHEVVQYRGEIMPLIRLSRAMGLSPSESDDTILDVVVYIAENFSVGIVVDNIVDIVDTTIDSTCSSGHSGRVGSAVIHDHVTDLLDLPSAIREFVPSSFCSPTQAS